MNQTNYLLTKSNELDTEIYRRQLNSVFREDLKSEPLAHVNPATVPLQSNSLVKNRLVV